MTLDPALQITLRAALALLWLVAASHKLRDLLRFRAALAGYALVPESAVRALAALVIALELALGVTLLAPAAGAYPALASAALLAAYAGAIALNLAGLVVVYGLFGGGLALRAYFSERQRWDHHQHVRGVYAGTGIEEYLASKSIVFVDSITDLSRQAMVYARQQPEAFSERTGKPDVRGAYGLLGERARDRIAWALDNFELRERESTPTGMLPGGFQRRLAMAAALLHEPQIVFLDEPTSGADPLARREFWRRISALADHGTTIGTNAIG